MTSAGRPSSCGCDPAPSRLAQFSTAGFGAEQLTRWTREIHLTKLPPSHHAIAQVSMAFRQQHSLRIPKATYQSQPSLLRVVNAVKMGGITASSHWMRGRSSHVCVPSCHARLQFLQRGNATICSCSTQQATATLRAPTWKQGGRLHRDLRMRSINPNPTEFSTENHLVAAFSDQCIEASRVFVIAQKRSCFRCASAPDVRLLYLGANRLKGLANFAAHTFSPVKDKFEA